MNADELCAKYEVRVNKYRTRPKREDEIITEVWAEVTQRLEERSFLDGVNAADRKSMRLAAREIRHALAKAGHVSGKDVEILRSAQRVCYNMVQEVLEQRVAEVDAMARLIVAKHPLHRRLNVVRAHLVHVINVIADSIENLRC